MLIGEHKNIILDFLTHTRFRVWRHLFIVIILSFVSVGQSLFVLGEYKETLGKIFYWFGIGNAAAIIAFFYFNLYYLTPRFLLKNRYIEYCIALLAGTLIYLIIKGTVEYFILRDLGITLNINYVTLLDGISNLMLYTICIASSSAAILFKQWITDTERIHELENNQLKKSVDEIKSHINPESLFNVLDYASEKVKTDPDEVSEVLFKLSDVLRYELYDCKRDKVLLESDIEFIDNYLSLEQLNSRNKFTYTITVANRKNLFVPSSVFLPVIRRVTEMQPTDILINFDIREKRVILNCKTSGMDMTKCDLSKEEQNFSVLHGGNIKINKSVESIDLLLNI